MTCQEEVCTSALRSLLLFVVLITALTDSTTCLMGIIAMEVECVGSGREGFGWATFPITNDSFLLVEIGSISLVNWLQARHGRVLRKENSMVDTAQQFDHLVAVMIVLEYHLAI